MIFTVSTIFHIVHVVAGLFAKESRTLSTSHVEALFTTGSIALHTRSSCGLGFPTLFLTQVTHLEESILGDQAQNDGLHGGHIAKSDFWNVQSAHHVCPAVGIRTLECPFTAGTKFTSHTGRSFLRFTFSAEPRTSGHGYNAITGLMDGHITAHAIAIHQRVLIPASFIRAHAASAHHLTVGILFVFVIRRRRHQSSARDTPTFPHRPQ